MKSSSPIQKEFKQRILTTCFPLVNVSLTVGFRGESEMNMNIYLKGGLTEQFVQLKITIKNLKIECP
jgi:hypothetical protein